MRPFDRFSTASCPCGDLRSIAQTLLSLKNDGETLPRPYFQRYRRDEYARRSFYQWWYFVIKDLQEDRFFAFHLNPVDTIRDDTRRGIYLMFSMVEKSGGTRFHKYERFPYEALDVDPSAPLALGASSGASAFHLESDRSGDHLRVRGELATPSAVWFSDGTLGGAPIAPGLPIRWDLEIHRIYGWYGEADLEDQMRRDGLTMWNPYAHTAEVEGEIVVDGHSYAIGRSSRYRAYCDMNWGSQFLNGRPARAYPWGWYYAATPGGVSGDEVAIIAGTGRSEDTFFPWTTKVLGQELAFEGKFADVELGGGRRIGAREVEFFRRLTDDQDGGFRAADGLKLVRRSSDGGVRRFEVYRGDWVDYTDRFGRARLPLTQLVRLQTKTTEVLMHFTCEVADCNRLLFPHEDYIFSDFEALGATCRVLVLGRDEPRCPAHRGAAQLRVLADFETNDAGLEFGYQAPGRV